MDYIYILLTRGGFSSGDETYLLFIKKHKPTYWKVQGFFSDEEKARQAEKDVDLSLFEAVIHKVPLSQNARWP